MVTPRAHGDDDDDDDVRPTTRQLTLFLVFLSFMFSKLAENVTRSLSLTQSLGFGFFVILLRRK